MSLITDTDYLQIENKKISQIREEDLKDEFGKFGPIAEIKLPMNRTYNRPKGFGFITFQNPNDAKVAKEELHDKDILGRTIRVDLSLPKDQLPPPRRDFGGGGYFSGGNRSGRAYDDRRGGGYRDDRRDRYDDRRGGGDRYDDRRGGGGGRDRGRDRDYDRRDRSRSRDRGGRGDRYQQRLESEC